MEEVINKLKFRPNLALIFPTFLCFLQFITNLTAALSDGVIDSNEFHKLMSSADGVETAILLVVMVVLRVKKK